MYIILGIVIVLLILYRIFEPSLDYIVVDGKKKRIIWYNTTNGRDWTFLQSRKQR